MFYLDINIPSRYGYVCENKIFDEAYTSRLHWHGFIEIEFVIDGNCTHQYNGKLYHVKRGDAWIFTAHDSHIAICDKGLNVTKVSVKPELLHERLQKYLGFSHPLHCSFDETELHMIQDRLNTLFDEQEHPKMMTRVKASSIINELVLEVVRKSPVIPEKQNLGIISDVVSWMHGNYKKDISLTQIAELFSLTPNYLGRLFKNALGISYNDYLNSIRLKCACDLLVTSDNSIKVIAIECGFNSVEYFNSIFKKHYGITPSQYRALAFKKM